MKILTTNCAYAAVLFALATMALSSTGCYKETDVGGPGAAGNDGGVADRDGAAANTFQLVMPSGEMDVAQGETKSMQIGIERGSDFDQSVSVKLMAPIEGLKVSPESATFSGDKSEIEFSLIAAADAPTGVTNVTVIGDPDSGQSVNGGIKVSINEG